MMQPRPNARASWPSGDDNAGFYLIVLLIGLCLAAVVLWMNEHAKISAQVMALFHWEIGVLRHFTRRFDLADQQMTTSDPAGVTLSDLYGIAHAVGMFLRIPAAALIGLLAAICALRAAPSRYRRAFNMETLVREQAATFRTTAAFVRRRLGLVAPAAQLRPSDYALTPAEWIARYAAAPDGSLDEAAARRALVVQLGAPWRGFDQASPHVRCLFAAFALHLAERRDDALHLLGDLSVALDMGDEDEGREGPAVSLILPAEVAVSAVEAVMHDPKIVRRAAGIAARHAYTHTALMSLLNEARLRGGVLASGQFAWLKLIDRELWYALHSLGFESEGFGRYLHPNPRVEAVGVRDHWAVERLMGGPLGQPSFDRALDTLRKVSRPAAPGPDDGAVSPAHSPSPPPPSGGSMPSSRRT
jgi:intracellular multiplication protein IcmP